MDRNRDELNGISFDHLYRMMQEQEGVSEDAVRARLKSVYLQRDRYANKLVSDLQEREVHEMRRPSLEACGLATRYLVEKEKLNDQEPLKKRIGWMKDWAEGLGTMERYLLSTVSTCGCRSLHE